MARSNCWLFYVQKYEPMCYYNIDYFIRKVIIQLWPFSRLVLVQCYPQNQSIAMKIAVNLIIAKNNWGNIKFNFFKLDKALHYTDFITGVYRFYSQKKLIGQSMDKNIQKQGISR